MLPLLVRIKLEPSGVPPNKLILPVAMLRPWLKLPVSPPVQAPDPSRFSMILRKAFCKPALDFLALRFSP
ncbi:orfe [Streptococcus phage Cp1]|uniref:Orfe protein n=1 Tax=Streptococcus phage Cp-1 TaxID=10747 RepID=Q38001_BPCP1|nr:orfe [Streptococcus phage Cp1]